MGPAAAGVTAHRKSSATIEAVMRRALASPDDRLLARLHAPPDLHEGVESLAYWQGRRQRLAWYRIRARREAARMIVRREQRVRGALAAQPGVPVAVRGSAVLLIARSRLRRWGRRAAIAVTAITGVTVLAAPFIAAVLLLSRVV
jgi:hypothetical protein